MTKEQKATRLEPVDIRKTPTLRLVGWSMDDQFDCLFFRFGDGWHRYVLCRRGARPVTPIGNAYRALENVPDSFPDDATLEKAWAASL